MAETTGSPFSLESAIFRPQSTFSDQELYPTIFDKAAVLIHSLVLNHPFIDGKKRTGTVSLILFLELNGFKIIISQEELVKILLKIENKSFDIEQIAKWLEEHSKTT